MSQENVEIVRKVHAAFSLRDLRGLLSLWHPECEYRAAITQAIEGEEGVFRGHEGICRWWDDLDDLYANLSSEILEVRDLGERLVVVFVIRSDAKGSGVAGEETLAQVARCVKGSSSRCGTTSARRKPSKPWGCRSKTLTPTPEPAGYCGAMSQENVELSRPMLRRVEPPRPAMLYRGAARP